MNDTPEGEPKEQPTEFEDIEGIKVDTRCPEEDKRIIREVVEEFLEKSPGSYTNMHATELEHIFGGSSISLTPDTFKPMDIILGGDPEEVMKKRRAEGYDQQVDIGTGSVLITNEGYQWLVEKIRELYPDIEEPPLTYEEAYNRFMKLEKSPWIRILFYRSLLFRTEAHTLDAENRISFPSVFKVGICNNLKVEDGYRLPPGKEGEFVYFENDPKKINHPSKSVILRPGMSGHSWQIYDPDNYRIEYHPEWKPDYDRYKI